jgi:NAD(P) transhydrogenase subunit beta
MSLVEHLTQATYLAAAALFIFSLRWLSTPKTARQGVAAGVAGMTLAVIGTVLHPEIVSYKWILIALVVGTAIGVPLSWVPLTAVPQRTALSHAFGGLAAGLVGTAKYMLWLQDGELTEFRTFAIVVEVLLGYLTFTGSLMAAGKLQEVLPTRPITYKNQNVINLLLLAVAIGSGLYIVARPETWQLFPVVVVLSLLFGVLLILPIGGADMPTVISLLNSYAGLSAGGHGLRAREQGAHHGRRARRVVGLHPVGHHVQGDEPLVHQRAVRRLRPGGASAGGRRGESGEKRDAARRGRHPREREQRGGHPRLRHGRRPGAAPRAGAVRPALEARDRLPLRDSPGGGPHARAHERAAGRGRGPYTALSEMDDINPDMPQVDVAIVVGANDVVNPRRGTTRRAPSSACRSSTRTRRRPSSRSSGR